MRGTRLVSADEFGAFLAANPGMQQRRVGQAQCYLGAGEWPDNLMASFLPASETRRRDSGWRIAVDEPEISETTETEGASDGEEG